MAEERIVTSRAPIHKHRNLLGRAEASRGSCRRSAAPAAARDRDRSLRRALAVFLVAFTALLAAPPDAAAQTEVPAGWSLIPAELGPGDSFRLLIVTSTRQTAESTTIGDYDTVVQDDVSSNGHAAIQSYSANFKMLGCTSTTDAVTNTNTGSSDTAAPIYWLNGAKVADNYSDLYDGTWDSNAPKYPSGANAPTTGVSSETFVGCLKNGTKKSNNTLGEESVTTGFPGVASFGISDSTTFKVNTRRYYGLSGIFEVASGSTVIGGAGVLVTNLSEPRAGGYELGDVDFAQPFTTGTNASGYQLESISIDFLQGRSREYEPVYVYVYGDHGNGSPNDRDQIATPTINGATFKGPVVGVNKYTVRKYGRPAPFNASSVHLDANTQYWVFLWAGEDKTRVEVDTTGSQDTGAAGWSIGDSGLIKPEGSADSNYTDSLTAMKIQVEGYANPEVLISISDATATEGPGVTADFVVTLNRKSSGTVTVDYLTLFTLSATPGVDFENTNGTLTFQPGETSKIISVPIIDDNVPDSGETFSLLLFDPKGADFADDTGIGTILNTEILTGSFENVPEAHDGLTGSFEGVPEAHDGQSAFSFRVAFSEDIGISYKTLRDESFTTTGGAVTGARRVDGRNDLWEITVKPSDAENVTITLPRRDCGTTGAVCTREDTPRALTNSPSATVAGPPSEPLTASFSGVPVSHDGQHAFTFGLTFSEDVAGLSYKTLRDLAFSETNGQVTQARRKQQGSNQGWTITVKPDTSAAVTIRLPETTNCNNAGAICTDDGRKLNHSTSATIPGPAVALDFAHFAKGATITSEMVLVNAAPHPSRPAIYFYDTKGDPIPAESVVDLTGDLEVTEDGGLTVRTEMEPLEALTISTHGRGEPVTGSVTVLSDGPIGGVVRYSVPEIGVAGVGPGQPTSDALFPVRRQAGGIRTAAALHNLEAEAMGVRCRLMSGGVALEEVEIHLEANGQASWFIEDAFTTTDTSDFLGSVRCTAPGNGRFTAVALEMDASNRIFTTLPVVPVDPPGSGNQQTTLDFAHFANGTGITSEMVFLNPSTQPSRPAVYFYDTEGNPIAPESVVDITGDLEIAEDGALTVQTEMEPLGVLTISTHGRGPLVSGSVRVVSDGPIGGLLRFDLPGVGAGVVGASPPISDAIFPVRRQEGGINTWVALHNLESSAGLVHCDLMREGVLLDGASIPLEANGQTSWFIDQAFPDTDTSDFAGSVRCSAPGGDLFTAVALEMDPGTRIFTTLPVVPVPERTDRE